MPNLKGFTLVEIMIVVAIIALLAAIVIPNIKRAQLQAQLAKAQKWVNSMRDATETFQANRGIYPTNVTSLTGATPPYIHSNHANLCNTVTSGFLYACNWFDGSGIDFSVSTDYTEYGLFGVNLNNAIQYATSLQFSGFGAGICPSGKPFTTPRGAWYWTQYLEYEFTTSYCPGEKSIIPH